MYPYQSSVSRLMRSARLRRSAVLAAMVTTLVAGFLAGWPRPVPPVVAQICGVAPGCGGRATASVTVNHRYWDEDLQQAFFVEPVDTDTLLITSTWYTGFGGGTCSCTPLVQAQATVDVTWSDTNKEWTATCTSGCNATTGPIFGVSVCPAGGCGDDPPTVPFQHSWAYHLMVQIADTLAASCGGIQRPVYVAEVGFGATNLDDGEVIDDCEHDITVTPDISGPIGATDYGTFECADSCNQVTGPSFTIEYVLP